MKLDKYLKLNFLSPMAFSKMAGVSITTIRQILREEDKNYHEHIKKKIYDVTEKQVNLNNPLDY